jgi:LPS O-antigen subunit length determinant protein (WzzB/FepE family)
MVDQVFDILSKLEAKLDKLDERLDAIEKEQIKNNVLLDEHMRRTEIAEQNIEMIRKDMKPLTSHVSMVKGVGKFIALLGTIVGIIGGLFAVFGGK